MNSGIMRVVKKVSVWVMTVLIFAGLLFIAYNNVRSRMPGRVANAQIEVDTSVIFSTAEIESAINVAIRDFASSRDSWNELLKIRYCELYSNALVKSRGWDAGNFIIIVANYQRNSAPGSNRPSTMRQWEWALYRDELDDTWRVAARGKTL